jgi:hypothetical protein
MGLSASSLEIWRAVSKCTWRKPWDEAIPWGTGGTCLHLRIGPAGHFDDHVEDCLLLIGIERDVVPWRDELAVLLNVDAVLERIRGSDFAGSVGHVGWSRCRGVNGGRGS